MSKLKAYSYVQLIGYTPREQRAFYLKSEADKVIAHANYKRCLAMANYWGLVSACTRRETQLKCMRRELKWRKLANKFKETK